MDILSGFKYQSSFKKVDGLNIILDTLLKDSKKKIFVDENNPSELITEISKIRSKNIVINNIKTFIPSNDFSIVIISNPNKFGEILDLANIISFLHSKNILVALNVNILSLGILKAPAFYKTDLAFNYGLENVLTIFSNYNLGGNSVKYNFTNLNNKATLIHGMSAYLEDALAVYDFHQKNNSYFNKLLLSIPDSSSFEKIKAADEDNDIDMISIDDNNLCLTINENTDIDMINYILSVFSEATDNFAQEVDINTDFTKICSLDNCYLREKVK